jgi:hypothetical protein
MDFGCPQATRIAKRQERKKAEMSLRKTMRGNKRKKQENRRDEGERK